MPLDKLEHAKKLADQGLTVIPIIEGDKRPCVEWSTYQTNKPTETDLNQWFGSANSNRNIGIVTGALSGVVVVDVDNPDAFDLDIPKTPTAKTAKGYHYYFAHPGFDTGNPKLPFGDLKGDGGYVVAPPSLHPSGAAYEWTIPFGEVPLASLPDELVSLAFKTKAEPKSVGQIDFDCETTAYGEAWFKDAEELAKCKSGNRNRLLNDVACKAGSLIAGGQLNRLTALAHMLNACRSNGLMWDKASGGGKAVDKTIASGLKAGYQQPRYPTEDEPESLRVEPVKAGKLNLIRLSDVKSEKIDWLWPGVLAKSKLSLIAGQGGVGKSTLVADLAARITTGRPLPATNHKAEIGDVLIIQLEEGAGDTVKPHIIAAGGDPNRVLVLSTVTDDKTGTSRPISLRDDFAALSDAVKALPDLRLIVIDPIMGYMGNLNPDKANEVRKIMTPLQILAEETDACILIIAHTNKSEDKRAINSVQGSGAFIQAVRTAFSVYKDADDNDRRVMAPLKNNLAKDDQSYAFRIESRQVQDNGLNLDTTAIVWEAESYKGTAEDALQNSKGGPAVREAREFLAALLSSGPKPYKDVLGAAKDLGISSATLYRARDDLKVFSQPKDDVPMWTIPQTA